LKPRCGRDNIIGWTAVGFSTLITSVWAFWGITENFHEGWYLASFWMNIGLMFVQYLSPMLLFAVTAVISIRWGKIGAALHVVMAVVVAGFFHLNNAAAYLLILPFLGIGGLYWFSRLQNKRLAYSVAVGIPFVILVVSGIGPVVRVSQRVDDGDRQARMVQGNGIGLVWAPAGQGWPNKGKDWFEAMHTCQYLSGDGLTLEAAPQNIWRLPTVDEVVRSMALHGKNSGGIWDAESEQAAYKVKPDKESPLWDVQSQVIYWWTSTEINLDEAYIIVYDGKVWPRSKDFGPAYLGYRCVKLPDRDS